MKTLDNKQIMFNEKPVTNQNEVPHTTGSIIKDLLENSAYSSSADLLKASQILNKLQPTAEKLNFEDDDFAFIKRYSAVFVPMVTKGLVFLDFYKQLEDVK